MTDPYRILGVPPDASDEQIKTAYRELARKYHPDNYADNPLADLASEKMKEINNAYDEVMRLRSSGQQASSSAGYGYGSSSGSYSREPSRFADIRRLINAGRSNEAEELLDGVPTDRRDGEWYFLKGTVSYAKGWLDDAVRNFTTACNMSPENTEYRAALNQLLWQRQTGYARTGGGYYRSASCDCCDLCAAFYCANLCCGCMR